MKLTDIFDIYEELNDHAIIKWKDYSFEHNYRLVYNYSSSLFMIFNINHLNMNEIQKNIILLKIKIILSEIQ